MVKRRGKTCRRRKLSRIISTRVSVYATNHTSIYLLLKWMSLKGFYLEKILQPFIFKETGRGLICKEVIRKGEIIVSIPKTLFISASSAEFYLKKCPPRILGLATELDYLTIFLMCEKKLGVSSNWLPYLNTLPDCYTTPSGLSPSCLQPLPKDLYAQSIQQRSLVDNLFSKLQPLLLWLENTQQSKDKFSFDLFCWAWNTVNTRCIFLKNFKGQRKIVLLPFLDLLNHSFDAKVDASYNCNTEAFEITSGSHIKRYQQVFIHYGNHHNRNLFLNYGFVIPENPNDLIPILKDDIRNFLNDSLICHKLCLSHRLEAFQHHKYFEECGVSRGGISWTLKLLLTYISLPCSRDIRRQNIVSTNPKDTEVQIVYKNGIPEIWFRAYKKFILITEQNSFSH